ncbi:zinc-dependent alcohol dehydrogenase family protein [Treponema sp. OttesenSCG-928-L16]|nr:zinc-dependent alcohol dehydrogenase family protein [Treponema sp. OttesenSCG-928-L16]
MKAAVFHGIGDIRIEDAAVRQPKEHEVVVKIAYCGICGTDVHIYHGDKGAAETVPPIILGHEMSGIITETGAGVKRLKPGDHVAIDPNYYCGECYYCRSGQEHLCASMNGIGTTLNGGFAEYCTLPAKAVLKVPNDMPLDEAAFAEPLACCLHGIDLTNISVGNQVLLIGGGTIGLIMLQLTKLAGASFIRLIEPDEKKRELALRLGADQVFANEQDYAAFAQSQDDVRADRVIECVGKTETVAAAIRAATKGATIMLFGLTPPEATVEIRPFEIFQKELHITASFVNPLTEARAVELLASGRIRTAELISERIPLEQLADALSNPKYRKMAKVLVKLS